MNDEERARKVARDALRAYRERPDMLLAMHDALTADPTLAAHRDLRRAVSGGPATQGGEKVLTVRCWACPTEVGSIERQAAGRLIAVSNGHRYPRLRFDCPRCGELYVDRAKIDEALARHARAVRFKPRSTSTP